MLEKQVEKSVCDYAKLKGFLCYKFVSPAHASVPDRIFLFQGKTFFIEFKRPGGKPNEKQVREMARIEQQSVPCWVIDDIEKGKELIDAYRE